MRLYHYLRKRGLALFMALVMCLSLLPAEAMAVENYVQTPQSNAEWTKLDYNQLTELLGPEKDPADGFTAAELLAIEAVEALKINFKDDFESAQDLYFTDSRVFQVNRDNSVVVKPKAYKITWDFNDGTSLTDTASVDEGTVPTHDDPTRTGYTFTGWLSGEIVYGGTAGNAFPSVTGDVTYVAQWTENTYTITWISDGNAVGSSTAKYGETPVYGGEPLSKDGFTFKCWAPEIAAATGDVTYTAVWEETQESTTYTVTYTDGVENVEVFADQTNTVNAGAATPTFNGTPTRDGYAFTGWTPVPTGTVTGDVTYTAQWTQVSSSGTTDGEEMQTASVEALANDGPDDVGEVYLWAKFQEVEEPETDGPKITAARLSNGTSLLEGNDIEIIWDKTDTLAITAEFESAESTKSIVVDVEPGLRAAVVGDPTKDATISEYKDESTQDPERWGGYGDISGQKLTYTVGSNALTASIGLTLSVDKSLWDQRNRWTVEKALTITVCEGEKTKQLSANEVVLTGTEEDIAPGIHSADKNRLVPMKENEPFQMRYASYLTQMKGNFFESLTAKVYLPYITVGDDRVYAEYASCTLSGGTPEEPQPDEVRLGSGDAPLQDETGRYVELQWNNVYRAGNTARINPYFIWPNNSLGHALDRMVVDYNFPVFTGKFYSDPNPIIVSRQKPSDSFHLSETEYFEVPNFGSASRYNWYTENPDLIYHLGNFYLKNNGLADSGPQLVEFTYGEADKIGVVEQAIPVGLPGNVQIWYKTNQSDSWVKAGNIEVAQTAEQLSDGGCIQFKRSDVGLSGDAYFTGIRALVPGYVSNYVSYNLDGAAGLNAGSTMGKMRDNGVGSLANWATMTLTPVPNTVPNIEGIDQNTGAPFSERNLKCYQTLGRENAATSGSLGFSGRFTNSVMDAGTSSRFTATLQSGTYPDGNTQYTKNPEFVLTLPKGITLNSNIGYTVSDTASFNDQSEVRCWLDSTELQPDGSTKYTIRTENLRIGRFAEGDTAKEARISIELGLETGLGSQLGPLDMSKCLSVNLWGGAELPVVTKPVNNVSATINPAPKALMLVSGQKEDSGITLTPLQHVDKTETGKEFTVTFSAWNNADNAISGDLLTPFVYYIPVPTKAMNPNYGKADFDLMLKGVGEVDARLQLAFSTADANADPSTLTDAEWDSNSNAEALSAANWIKITATEGTVNAGDACPFRLTFAVKDPDELSAEKMVQFRGKGKAVKPSVGDQTLAMSTDAVNVEVTNLPYTVYYMEKLANGGAKEIKTSTPKAMVGEVIQSYQKEYLPISGYTYESVNPSMLTVTSDGDNRITFYYTKTGAETPDSVLTITANSLETYYDGVPHTVKGFVGQDGSGRIPVTGSDGNVYYVENLKSEATGTNVADSMPRIEVSQKNVKVINAMGDDVTRQFTIKVNPGHLTIKPRTVTLTSESEIWDYDGKEHARPEVKISDFDGNGNGFVSGEGYAVNPTATGKITDYGYVVNEITDGTLNANTKSENYTIVKSEGMLCVRPNPDKAKFEVTVTAKSGEFTYDGAPHTVSGFVVGDQEYDGTTQRIPVTVEGGKTYYVSGLSSSKTSTNVADSGQTEISGSVQVWDAETEGKNVTQDFLVKVVPGKLTIKPRAITLTSGSETREYTGAALTAQSVTATLTGGGNGDAFVGGDGAEYTYYASQLNVGSCDNVFTYKLKDGTLAENYAITTEFGRLEVTTRSEEQRYYVTITAGSDTVKYDGNTHTVNTFTINGGTTEYASGTAASFTASNNQTYTISGIAVSNPEAKNVATDGYQVTVSGNYKVTDEFGNDVTNQFKFETKAGKLTITPRQVTLTSANDSKPYDGRPLTNHTVTVGGDGFVEGEGVTYSFTGSQTLVGSTEGNNTFSIASWNAGTLEDNYKPTIIPGTLTVTDRPNDAKYEITVETGNKAVTYNGQEQSLPGSFTKDVLIDGRTYTVHVTAADAKGKDADTYQTGDATYTVTTVIDRTEENVTNQFTVHVTPGKLTITPRPVTLTSPSASKAYDGTPLTAPKVTIGGEGFVNGEVDLGTVKATGSAMNAGDSVTNAITYTKGSSYKDSNYAITKYEGTLQVYDRSAKYEVTIKAVDASVVYDGGEHSITKYSIDGEENATRITRNGHTFTITGMSIPTNEETDAGTYPVLPDTTNVKVTDSTGKDVKDQFHIVPASGTLTITPRPVILESDSVSKVYDGTALTAGMKNPSTTANDGKPAFIGDDGASMVCTPTGSRTLVGFSPNTFDWNWKDGTADTTKSNYAISVKTGTLTVTNPDSESKYQITVKVDDLTVTYDGNPHKITDYSVVGSDSITVVDNHAFYMNGEKYTIEGLAVKCDSRTNVEEGSVTATVDGSWAIKDALGHVVSEAFKVTPEGGTLTITPRPITLRSGNDSKVYDGKPLSKEGVTVEGTFADKEGFDYSNFKHVTFVTAPEGEDNTFDYAGKAGTNTKLSNYDVKVEPGKLIIRDRSAADRYPVTVERDGKEVVYNGREQSIEAETITQTVTVGEGEDARGYTVTVVIPELAGTDAGTYSVDPSKVTVTVITKDSDGKDVDVTAQFDVKLELGDLTINKKFLTITTEGGSMTYSGQPLTNPNVTVDGLENGETLVVRTTGSQTAVGSSANNYVIDWANSTAKEDNYQITSVLGQLVVNASQPPIIIPTPTPTPTPVTPTPTPTPTPGGTTITDEETPLGGAVGLNDTDHYAYIAGYEDDTVRPTKNITRAEVATIFFRLMTEEFRVANWATENTLKDVQASDWYNNAVSTCANAGIITGYTDGRFQPQKAITRAEFAVIASRFLGPDADDEGVGDFSDTADHWAAAEIRKAAKAGWITGDGNKFRPNDPITRAEVMVIVNRMLDRTPDAEHMLPDMKIWIDNPEGTWYYEAVQEATNGHDYERDELNVETWTAIQAEKNWKAIEAEWAANNGASASKDDAEPVEADGESK